MTKQDIIMNYLNEIGELIDFNKKLEWPLHNRIMRGYGEGKYEKCLTEMEECFKDTTVVKKNRR